MHEMGAERNKGDCRISTCFPPLKFPDLAHFFWVGRDLISPDPAQNGENLFDLTVAESFDVATHPLASPLTLSTPTTSTSTALKQERSECVLHFP